MTINRLFTHLGLPASNATILRLLSLTLLITALTACSSSPPPSTVYKSKNGSILPSFQNIRSKPNYDDLPQIFTPEPDLVQFAQVNRITLPYARPLDSAWSLVDENAIPPITRAMWHNNGLRIGLIQKSKITQFLDTLPETLNADSKEFAATSYPTPIRTSPPLGDDITLDLTTPPYTANIQTLNNGKLQLLAQLVNQNNKTSLKLTPHHYLPKTALEDQIASIRRMYDAQQSPTFYTDNQLNSSTLALPTTLESNLHGTIYSDLALTVHVPETHFLIVGLYWPWTQEIQYAQHFAKQLQRQRKQQILLAKHQTAKANADQAAKAAGIESTYDPTQDPNLPQSIDEIELGPIDSLDELPPEARIPFLPPHPGRALFASNYAKIPSQLVLVINVTNPDLPINLPAQPKYLVNQNLPQLPNRSRANTTSHNSANPHPTLNPTPYNTTNPRYQLNDKLPQFPHLQSQNKSSDKLSDELLPPHPQQ
ncbi:hypothetical protein JD969_16390 [Planctomycetota bacterium]|nr:hypothetical protein JD969_16390 [Planctomycetota bacterium]